MRYSIFVILLGLGFFSSMGLFEDAFAQVTINSEDFENPAITWDNTSGDDNDCWFRDDLGTPTGTTGPSTGPAFGAAGTDFYNYFESSSGCSGGPGAVPNEAFLAGPSIDFNSFNGVTVDFSYHMNGIGMGTLELQLESATVPGTFATIFTQSGNLGDVWNTATIDLSSEDNTGTRDIRFVATKTVTSPTQHFLSDMAVDEILIQGTAVVPPGPSADYGDAPDSYGTLFASGGPHHLSPAGSTQLLGNSKDVETNGFPSLGADGDDLDGINDETGVNLPATISAGSVFNFDIFLITANANSCVNAWIDFDGDGVFDDNTVEEVIAQCGPFASLNVPVSVPSNAMAGDTYVRVRIASDFSATTPLGVATDGEVQDYKITILNPMADLEVTKDAVTIDGVAPVGPEPYPVNFNEVIVFDVVVTNNGPSSATSVEVTDVIDPNLNLDSFSITAGSFAPGTGIWTLGTMASGASETLTLTTTVLNNLPMTNTAQVTNSGTPDPDLGNNMDSVMFNVLEADLRVEKTVDDLTPLVGQIVTYTLSIINDGPDTATGVEALEIYDPAALSFDSFGSFTCNPGGSASHHIGGTTLSFLSNNIPSGSTCTIELSFLVLAPGAILNTIEIIASDQWDVDSIVNNGMVGEDDEASITITATFPNGGDSGVHQRPVITLPFVDPGFCFDLTCLTVEPGTVFTHLDLQTVNSGSTHTISLTIHCHYGVEKCNYAAIGASPPGTDMRDAVWKIILTKNIDGTWDLTKIDPNGDLGDVTATAQKVNDNKQLQVTFNIEFLLASLLGSPPEGEDFPEGSQIINVEIRDSKGGYSSYIFNEGFAVNDIYAYPQVETSFDAPLVYEKLCLNEDEKDRNTCAFEMVQKWTIQQAEEKLKEIYGQYSYEMDSYDESEQYKK